MGLKMQLGAFCWLDRILFLAIKEMVVYLPGPGLLSGWVWFSRFRME
jgi:hypothetical protein